MYPGKIGLGMGDVTLATFIGLAVGFPSAIVAVVLGVLMGGLVSGLLLVTRRVTLQSALPYGPYLVVGGLVATVLGTGHPQVVLEDVTRGTQPRNISHSFYFRPNSRAS